MTTLTTSPRRLLLVASCLLGAATAAAGQAPARGHVPARRAGRAKPNVLLITIDTVRADRVGCYGYQPIATPAIDGLCRDGIVFDRALSQVPLTWPSHVAILTGTYPFWNGVQDFTGQPLRPSVATLPEAMRRNGYATGAVVSSFVLDRSFGMARGFDSYYDSFRGSAFLEKDLALVERRAGESVDAGLKWLKSSRRPFFFWLHLYDPHSPYNPPEPFRSQYRDRPYDGEIAYADSQVARVIAWLKQAGLYDSTVIVLASDHGESLGEHGEREHGYFIYQSTARVPLIVKPPRSSGLKPRREAAAVETIGIAPTILELVGAHDPIQRQFQAPSLLDRGPQPRLAYSQTLYPFSSFGWSPLRSLENSEVQYVEAPEPELYDLVNDPGEEHNLVTARPALAAAMKEKLAERMQRFPPPELAPGAAALAPDVEAKLRALGYLSYKAPAAAAGASLADPKQKLREFNAILRATDLLQVGDFAGSQAVLESVRATDPKMYLIPFLLAEGATRSGNMPLAITEFRQTLELNPSFDQAMLGLARALHAQGQNDEARQWLKQALAFNPQNFRAWYQIAHIELGEHRDEAAVAAFARVLAIQPNFGLAYRDLGMLRIRQKDYAAAAPQLARAAELGVEEAPLYNFLGIAYGETGKPEAALQSYRHAVALDPALAEARLNLAISLARAGQRPAARAEYREACRLKPEFCQYIPPDLR